MKKSADIDTKAITESRDLTDSELSLLKMNCWILLRISAKRLEPWKGKNA